MGPGEGVSVGDDEGLAARVNRVVTEDALAEWWARHEADALAYLVRTTNPLLSMSPPSPPKTWWQRMLERIRYAWWTARYWLADRIAGRVHGDEDDL